MSMLVSFCAVFFFPRGVLDDILNLIESVSVGFPSYSWLKKVIVQQILNLLSEILQFHGVHSIWMLLNWF